MEVACQVGSASGGFAADDNGLRAASQRDQRLGARGARLLTVAQVSGTSAVMIECHYGHFRSEVAATALAHLAL
jgi:hypothetical protein